MTDTTTAAPPARWGRGLEDSVDALAWAADRLRRALQQAQILRDGADYTRVVTHKSRATAVSVDGSRTRDLDPDGNAVSHIVNVYETLATQLQHRYEDAAWELAYGAHWALREVLAGRTPDQAHITVDPWHGGSLPTGDITELAGLVVSAEQDIETARRELDRHLAAAVIAEDIAGQDYVTDHEAGQMHDALDVACGTAGAAHAYGLACQRWLPLTIRYAEQARTAAAAAAGEGKIR